ncbi:MAG: hypothetical protein ACI9TY_001670 [Alphaproteobacteria bacterium]|jgi:hypothetical protein
MDLKNPQKLKIRNKLGKIKMYKLMTLVVASVVLTGCLSSKKGPDEMAVLDSAPLTLPPSFELRPPRQGQAPAVIHSNKKAKDLILGDKKVEKTVSHSNDAWLLNEAGADASHINIREVMAAESRTEAKEVKQKGWFESMFSEEENTDPSLEDLIEIAKDEEKNKNN